MRFGRALLIATTGLCLGGCTTRFSGVPPPALRTVPASLAGASTACTFRVERIDDRRERPWLAKSSTWEITDEGIVDWLASSVAQIPGYHSEAAATSIRLELLKAYIEEWGPVLRANLVVKLLPDRETEGTVYRGLDATTRLIVDESDVPAAFDRAMGALIVRIAQDAGAWCHA